MNVKRAFIAPLAVFATAVSTVAVPSLAPVAAVEETVSMSDELEFDKIPLVMAGDKVVVVPNKNELKKSDSVEVKLESNPLPRHTGYYSDGKNQGSIWLNIPGELTPGTYRGHVLISKAGGQKTQADFSVQVISRVSYARNYAYICKGVGDQSFKMEGENQKLKFSVARVYKKSKNVFEPITGNGVSVDPNSGYMTAKGVSVDPDSGAVTVNGIDFEQDAGKYRVNILATIKDPAKGSPAADYKGFPQGLFQIVEADAEVCQRAGSPWADRYDPSYDTGNEVAQGQTATVDGPQHPPAGTVFSKDGDEPSWATVGEDGSISLHPGLDVEPGKYNVAVKVTYSDDSSETLSVPVKVLPEVKQDSSSTEDDSSGETGASDSGSSGKNGSSEGCACGKSGSGSSQTAMAAAGGAFGAFIALVVMIVGAVRAGILHMTVPREQ